MIPERDVDPIATQERIGAIGTVVEVESSEKAHSILSQMLEAGRRPGAKRSHSAATPDLNAIPLERHGHHSDRAIEHRFRSMILQRARHRKYFV
ncbi:hypothetical protein ACFFWD_34305 [Bradyrhizobium erythrophlei]|uniref:hypothetical protein n=1 Tax=Bradyrhizobium erythrophlei TaxID=1437360 RepID=UPI0035E586AD